MIDAGIQKGGGPEYLPRPRRHDHNDDEDGNLDLGFQVCVEV